MKYQLKNIYLEKSTFDRQAFVKGFNEDKKFDIQMDFAVGENEDKSEIVGSLTVIILLKGSNSNIIDKPLSITYTGIFGIQEDGDERLKVEAFKSVNIPAMIYPYIRAKIAEISVNADVKKLLLPPMDFTQKGLFRELQDTNNQKSD